MLARAAGVDVPQGTQILYGETGPDHPFVEHEQTMPFIPRSSAWPASGRAIALAKQTEHGYGHTAILHSRDTSVMSRMGKVMDCTVFVINGASPAGLGLGGEGFSCSLSRDHNGRRRDHPAHVLPPEENGDCGGDEICLTASLEMEENSMQLGRVVGTVTSTIKHPTFQGERILRYSSKTPRASPMVSQCSVSTGWGPGGGTWCL